jgi:diguanylate cyclase (GGDEF)-like protein
LVDIDFFKHFNDRGGHAAADVGLKSLADCLREVAQRSTDLAARHGGDEFALILPDTKCEGALAIARRVQKMIELLKLKNPGSPISSMMTVSQGVVTALPDRKGSSSGLMLEADRALYQAKQMGKARIAVARSKR